MTTTPPEAPAGPPADAGPRVTREEVRDLGRLRRTIGPDRKLAGVAGGLARHLDVDPVLVRVAMVVLVFFGGAGVLVYAACWLLVPEDGNARASLHLDERNRTFALLGVGALAMLALLADSVGQLGFPWPIVAVAILALIVLTVLDRDKNPAPTAPPVPHVTDPATGQLVPAPAGVPVAAPPAYQRRPRNPRKRGPILFWFTLALAAVAVGVLGVLDLAGVPVADPAYPAAVVAICGVMLLVGSVYGRAGGVIVVGLVASLVLAGATAASELDNDDVFLTPGRAAEVDSTIQSDAGEVYLDLRQVEDLAALDGRHLELDVTFGRVELVLPPGLSADVNARVKGGGRIELFRSERDGFDVRHSERLYGGDGAPEISVDVTVAFGEIHVREGDPT